MRYSSVPITAITHTTMTPHQTKKFLRSDEFDAACNLVYPFGYEEVEANYEKIDLVDARRRSLKAQWEAIYYAGIGGDWSSPENLPEFHRVSSAQVNADASAREKCCEVDSAEYYRIALGTYDSSQ